MIQQIEFSPYYLLFLKYSQSKCNLFAIIFTLCQASRGRLMTYRMAINNNGHNKNKTNLIRLAELIINNHSFKT